MTGDKSARVQLTFEKDSDRITHEILKKAVRDSAIEHSAGPAYTDLDRDDDLAEASAVFADVAGRLRELKKNPSLATREELQDMLVRALKAEQLVHEDF